MLLKAEWKHFLFDDFLKPKPIELLVLFSVIFLELTLGKINPQLPILPEASFCKVTSSPKISSKRKTIFTGSLCSSVKKPIRKSFLSSPGRIHRLKPNKMLLNVSAESSDSSSSTEQINTNDRKLSASPIRAIDTYFNSETASSKNTCSSQPSSSLRRETEAVTRRDKQSSPAFKSSRFPLTETCKNHTLISVY